MRPRKGMSLVLVLVLVSVMAFLSAAMTGLFLMNLNYTQGTFNGDVALSQAEAGLSEVLYRLGQDDLSTYGQDAKATLHGSVSSDLTDGETHWDVSFDPSRPPYSTNNVDGSKGTGYLNRTIPKGFVHVLSRGVCRGQVRLLEALVARPPCPYGLASSGAIHSKTPLTVLGTSDAGALAGGENTRPGHLVSNSPDGIDIGAAPNMGTNVTGFIKSVGPIHVALPAEVRGGLRPNASTSALPEVNLDNFDPSKTGTEGFFRITDAEHPGQEMDVLYYCDHSLTIQGASTMKNAFLFVRGDLTMNGGIQGVGAIAVTGNVTINGGADLAGKNQIALLAGGRITLRGAGNYFQGFLYSKDSLDASKLTVVGTAIVNSPDPTRGGTELDQVTVVADPKQGVINIPVASYRDTGNVSPQNAVSNNAFTFKYYDASKDPPWQTTNGASPDRREDLEYMLLGKDSGIDGGSINTYGSFLGGQNNGLKLDPILSANYNGPSYAGLNGQLTAAQEAYNAYAKLLADPPDDTATPAEEAAYERALAAAQAAATNSWNAYADAAKQFAKDYWAWWDRSPDGNGAMRGRVGAKDPDFFTEYNFDINKYMPKSDRMQLTFFRVTNERE